MNDDILQSLKARQNPSAVLRRAQGDSSGLRPSTVPHVYVESRTRSRGKRRGPFLILLLLGLGAMIAVLTVGSVVAGPALASMVSPITTPTSIHSRSFAQVWIPKPTSTLTSPDANLATATLLPTITPTHTADVSALQQPNGLNPTSTPGAIFAEIVADTPTLEYVQPDAGDATVNESAPAPSYGGNKYILVDISEQHMYVYENDALVYSFVASTGMNNATAVGAFSVLDKIPNAYGATWDIWMPNWMGIYWAGGLENGIHALPILPSGATLWSGFLGRPISYGCVVLGGYDAQLLFDWAEVGTPVEIRW